jgi:prepilin-type N-terminal cleavage/methylation domain-containing protein/prepilin-type processing-associated H-X9-DG protein
MITLHAPLRRRAGFTLIELLVVIAIVALLIGLSIPALGAARARARTTVCLAQAQQLAVAVNAFSAANKGRVPENRPLVEEGKHITWRSMFVRDGYVTPDKSWICRAQPVKPQGERGLMDNGTLCVGDVASSYALNGHVLWRSKKSLDLAGVADTAIARPSHTILIAETNAYFPDIRVTNELLSNEDSSGVGFYGYWHNRKAVYSFLDGHAEPIGLLDTGNPDCRWHNGKDFTVDPVTPQPPDEVPPHGHPDWKLLVGEIYRR